MRPGDTQGDGFGARERDTQDPLCLLLLVLFLQEQEKNNELFVRINDYLSQQRKSGGAVASPDLDYLLKKLSISAFAA